MKNNRPILSRCCLAEAHVWSEAGWEGQETCSKCLGKFEPQEHKDNSKEVKDDEKRD